MLKRTVFLLAFMLLSAIWPMSRAIAQSYCEITFMLKDIKDNPIANKDLVIYHENKTVLAKGISDANGRYVIQLEKGKKFGLEFVAENQPWLFHTEIPNEKIMSTMTSICKIAVEIGSGNVNIETASSSNVTIILMNKDRKIIANQKFKLLDQEKNLIADAVTDAEGKYKTTLLKNRKYLVETNVYGQDYSGLFDVGSSDNFTFQFMMSFTEEVVNVVQQNVTSNDMKLIVKVVDANHVPEQDAHLMLNQGSSNIMDCNTNIDGECSTTIDQFKTYNLLVDKMGKTFPFKIELPTNELYSEYTYTIVIKVVEEYTRTYKLENVYFDYNKFDIRSDALPALNELFGVMNSNPKMAIEIAGHTDSDGPDASNMHLSQNRANSVRTWLINKGISANRVIAKGYGETQPVDTNATPAGKQNNRRTEVRVITE